MKTNGPLADLARQLDDDVDIIFGGHSHSYINGNVNGKLLVQAYSYGKAFSNVTVTLNRKTKEITKKKQTSFLSIKMQSPLILTYKHGWSLTLQKFALLRKKR